MYVCDSCSVLVLLSIQYYTFASARAIETQPPGTAAAAPPPFRPSDPALCGS